MSALGSNFNSLFAFRLRIILLVERRKEFKASATWVKLRLNGAIIGAAYGGELTNDFSSGSLRAILKLKAGDQITVALTGGALHDNMGSGPHTHFTGSLIEEDLSIP